MTKEDKKNAYLYCKFRDEQFALYDAFAKRNGIMMNTFLVLNVLFYAKEGLTQRDICDKTFQSKQTVNLITVKEFSQRIQTVKLPEHLHGMEGHILDSFTRIAVVPRRMKVRIAKKMKILSVRVHHFLPPAVCDSTHSMNFDFSTTIRFPM